MKKIIKTSTQTKDYILDEVFHEGAFQYCCFGRSPRKYAFIPKFPDMYEPLENYEDIKNKIFFLPEKPEEYNSEEELDNLILEHLSYYDYPENYKKLDIAYIKLTWLSDFLETVPYRRALGDWGTGKSRWLECMVTLCRNGFKQGATATQVITFRKLDLYDGT